MNTRIALILSLSLASCTPWAPLDIDSFLPPADGAVSDAAPADVAPVEASSDSGTVLRADIPGADVVVFADRGIVWIADAPVAADVAVATDAGTVADAAREDAPVVPVDAPVAATDAPLACGPLEGVCGGVCVALLFDPAHCGRCGEACPADPHGEAVCRGGRCGVVCAAGYADCGRGCMRVSDDPANCGACGAAEVCAEGACRGCDEGESACGGRCVTLNTAEHCGSCSHRCPLCATCTGGNTCAYTSCAAGRAGAWTLCPSGCVDVVSDDQNCLGCGNVCAAGTHCRGGCN